MLQVMLQSLFESLSEEISFNYREIEKDFASAPVPKFVFEQYGEHHDLLLELEDAESIDEAHKIINTVRREIEELRKQSQKARA